MSKPIIEVNSLSKQYRLGEFSARSLRDEAEVAWNRLWKKNGHANHLRSSSDDEKESAKTFWALKDVSFTVQPGEVVGIIGRNGAGKSTLLKILSRITEPTSGEVIMRGRVASLLEVGTGFHPELSGRENIFLNGAILGMKKVEIENKFDEIVAFAEVEQFIDTPVKRYSSGMYVRLAFAVAAHLEPEILIVDEVLAVGDAEFQKKCLGKMQEVSSRDGRTVLFVSHQLAAIRRLCSSACLLTKGRAAGISSVESSINEYTKNISGTSLDVDLSSQRRSNGADRSARITRLQVTSEGGLQYGEQLILVVTVECSLPLNNAVIGMGFDTLDGYRIMTLDSDNSGIRLQLNPGRNEVRLRLDRNPLHPAMYVCGVAILIGGQVVDSIQACATWEVTYGPNVVACDRGFAGCRPAVDIDVRHSNEIENRLL